MTRTTRLALATGLALVLCSSRADAGPINVAEFRWDTITIPGVECTDPGDAACVPVDPAEQSVFSLTGLWDDLTTAAPALNGAVTIGGGAIVPWLELTLDAGYFDQFFVDGVPAQALTSIVFDFLGETRTLSALLDAPGFAVLSFDAPTIPTEPSPVPEPATFVLSTIGLGALWRSLSRRSERTTR